MSTPRGSSLFKLSCPGAGHTRRCCLLRQCNNDDSGADDEFKFKIINLVLKVLKFKIINLVLSVSEELYEEFQKETKIDPELQAVLAMVKNGWPDTKVQVPIEARPYWTFRDEVAAADGLLFKGTRLIVPKSLRPEMLHQIHKSHLGIVKCRQRAREVLFWPGMSVEIEQMVTNCSVCADYAKKQPSEPLKPSVPPSLPWKKIGTNLFEFRGEHYLLTVCYRSKFIEVTK